MVTPWIPHWRRQHMGCLQEPRTVPAEGTVDTWPRQFRFFGSRLRVFKRWEYQTSFAVWHFVPAGILCENEPIFKTPNKKWKAQKWVPQKSNLCEKKKNDHAGELPCSSPRRCPRNGRSAARWNSRDPAPIPRCSFTWSIQMAARASSFSASKTKCKPSPKSPNVWCFDHPIPHVCWSISMLSTLLWCQIILLDHRNGMVILNDQHVFGVETTNHWTYWKIPYLSGILIETQNPIFLAF